jgi:hypothetical protein
MTKKTDMNPYRQSKLDSEIQKTIDRISKVTRLSQLDVQEVLKEYFDIYVESHYDL